ncbi:DUF3099 domain-containing protein [Nocardia huaxiensis]|uniref:DUF3099 domain-containing protein n=1 Tax=Nocardia huaxiensis TaxID=2755382 RepID=A0A7D6ZF11_9NOCA|nr:DUF3099 domain-containing protein [Nocardia huaxiensis]QLY29419.1 DUF3099 domain-containing protein [Nocardia huaxiensis]UFS97033.1 DUF3099 domain-containing protein [Nocardia huaxiensis]
MQQDGESQGAVGGEGGRPEVEFRPAGSIPKPPRPAQGYFPGEKEHPALITEAQTSLEQQHRNRVRRYTIIMAFRIPCLVGAAIAYSVWGNWVISLLIIGVSIPLPWIAVLIANDRPPRTREEPSRWDGRRNQAAIESRPHKAIDG